MRGVEFHVVKNWRRLSLKKAKRHRGTQAGLGQWDLVRSIQFQPRPPAAAAAAYWLFKNKLHMHKIYYDACSGRCAGRSVGCCLLSHLWDQAASGDTASVLMQRDGGKTIKFSRGHWTAFKRVYFCRLCYNINRLIYLYQWNVTFVTVFG